MAIRPYIYDFTDSKSMEMNFLRFAMMFTAVVGFAVPLVLASSADAQNQNTTPGMVINMSDLSIKIGNTTSNQTITFSNNSVEETGNSTNAS